MYELINRLTLGVPRLNRAREALRACLPDPLRDATFSAVLKGDLVTKRCLASLLLNLSDRCVRWIYMLRL